MAKVKQTSRKSSRSSNAPKKPVSKKPAEKPANTEKKERAKPVRRTKPKYTLENTDLHHAIALEKRLTTAQKRERKPKLPTAVDHDLAKRIVACKSFRDFVNTSFKKEVGDAKPSASAGQIISRLVKQGIAAEKV